MPVRAKAAVAHVCVPILFGGVSIKAASLADGEVIGDGVGCAAIPVLDSDNLKRRAGFSVEFKAAVVEPHNRTDAFNVLTGRHEPRHGALNGRVENARSVIAAPKGLLKPRQCQPAAQ